MRSVAFFQSPFMPVAAVVTLAIPLIVGGGGCGSTASDPTPIEMWAAFDASGVPFSVHVIHVEDGRLIAAGNNARNGQAAEWSGTEWNHVWSGGSPGGVNAVAVFGGHIVVGGAMGQWHPNTLPPYSIAKVQGPYSDDVLGGGLDGNVHALVVYQGELVVGGHFIHAAGDSIPYLARWDGVRWRPVGGGVDGPVMSLEVVGDRLLVAGRFSNAGSVAARGLAWWNGVTWTLLGFDLDGDIHMTTTHQSTVVVTGWFRKPGVPARFEVARWQGASWEPVGTPVPTVTATVARFHEGRLYVGSGGGVRHWRLGEWEWDHWTPRPVHALASYRGSLIAGGRGWAPQLGQWVPNIMRVSD